MSQTIQGGALVGTSGNDDLRTLYYDIATETTTIYSALSGLDGDDALDNNGKVDNVTLDGGADNDRIYNTVNGGGQSPSIVGGDGDDVIENGYATTDQLKANDATIDAGAGADTVESYGDNATITAGAGDDRISNYGNKATISSGDGADTVSHIGDDSTIDAGAGNDSMSGYGNNVTVRGGAGNDSMSGYGFVISIDSKILLDDTDGDNYFRISNSTNSTINAGNGADTVHSDGYNKNLLINVGAGNNSIVSNYDSNVTINAAEGNDTINFYDGNGILIQAGEGDNYIYSYYLNSNLADMTGFTISSGNGNDTIANVGNDSTIDAGAGNDSIIHVGANSTIQGGDGDDYINNHDGGRDYYVNPSIGANNLVEGGAGNDSIYNACNTATINGGDGDDYISSNAVDGALINGGAGNDSIYNTGNINREFPSKTTLNGGEGDDFIDNLGNNVTIDGGAGNDTISLRTGRGPGYTYSGSENVLINYVSGDGNDLIQFFNATTTLSVGGGTYSSVISGSDVILTVGDGKITLGEATSLDNLNIIGTYGGDGDTGKNISNTTANTLVTGTNNADTITNSADNVTIQALGGNDSIFGATRGNSNIIIDAGDGNDVIETYGSNISVNAGNGNDSIHIFHNVYATVLAGAGNDTIFNTATDAVLDGGEGNDFIHNDLENVTITGGADDDIIENYGDNVVFNYSTGDGNDSIRGFDKNSTLAISGTYSTVVSGDDVIVNVGDGKITLAGAATVGTLNIISEGGGDTIGAGIYINNTKNSSLLAGTAYNDTIHNSGNRVTIQSGAGDDNISNYGGNRTTVDGGEGDDYIYNGGASVSVSGGDGNEYIYNVGSKVTINGGAGDDSISADEYGNNKVLIQYAAGDGNDSIYNFSAGSTLSIDGGTYSTVQSGADIIVTVGDNKITLSGVHGGTVTNPNIVGEYDGEDTTPADSTTLVLTNSDKSPVTIGTDVEIVDASARTKAIKIFGNDLDNTIISGQKNDTLSGGGGNDLFVYTAGKDVITDYEVGDKISLGSYDNASVKGDDVVFTIGKGSLTVKDAADKIITFDGGSDTAGKEISNSKSNTIVTGTAQADDIYNSGSNVTINALGGDDTVRNGIYDGGDGGGASVSIDGGDGNDNLSNYGADNITIIGGAGNDSIYNSPSAIYLNGERTHDWPNNGLIDAGDGDDFIDNQGEKISVNGGAGDDLIRNTQSYSWDSEAQKLVKNHSADNSTISGGAGNDSIENAGENVTFVYSIGDGNDKIFGFNETSTLSIDGDFSTKKSGKNIIVTVGKGKITLDGAATLETLNIISNSDTTPADSTTLVLTNSDKSPVTIGVDVEIVDASVRTKAIKIFGNDLDNTIISGQKNDTLSGGGGNDLFVYTAGKDVIADYEIGDKILLGSYDNASIKGDDVIFTVGKGSLTVKDAADKIITFDGGTTYGGGGEETSTTLVLTNSDKSPVTIGADVEIVDASARTKAIKIFGNDLDNTIISGQKNDTLSGGGGNDLFVYTAGKDVIADYEVGDKILLGSYDNAAVKGDDVVFTIGKGSLTVKDAADKIITFDDGTTYGGGEETSTTLVLTNSDKSPVTLESGVEIVDASARTKAIKIFGNDLDNTIIGGQKNDTLSGGGGNDLFVYTAGKDVIADYETGDKISLGSYDNAAVKGDDVIFTVGKGSLTVKDAADKVITFDDGTTFGGGEETSTKLVLTNSDKSPVTIGADVEIVDASARTKAIKIFGNALDNTIIGGAGNDRFWGEGGADKFIYADGGGKDIVYDFGADDLLEIMGDWSATYKKSAGDVVFKVGDGSVTLKDIDASATLNVNGDSYRISGTKLVK